MKFFNGARDGIPVTLGYLSVGFGFGIYAAASGLTPLQAFLKSITNLTSAGQVAGVDIMATGGTYLEMALTQLVINLRYALMAIALSQKLAESFHTPHRLLVSHGITDEIFAVAHAQSGKLVPHYMYGLIFISAAAWTGGTLLGAVAGEIMPQVISDAMGIMLYAMFLAVIIPTAKKERGVFVVICIAALGGILFHYLLAMVSSGFAVIISAIVAAAVGAWLFPVAKEEE